MDSAGQGVRPLEGHTEVGHSSDTCDSQTTKNAKTEAKGLAAPIPMGRGCSEDMGFSKVQAGPSEHRGTCGSGKDTVGTMQMGKIKVG